MQRLLSRLPLVLLPAVLIAALVLGVLVWRASDSLTPGVVTGSGAALVGGPFTLTDQDGRKRSSAEFRGRYMLIYFGYTYCPDVCPTTLALMADALARVGPKARNVVPLFITIDPERDTQKRLKEYVRSFGTAFIGLTGDLKTITSVANSYRVFFGKQPLEGGNYALDHSSVIYLMGPDGKFITFWDDTAIGPDKLATELREKL